MFLSSGSRCLLLCSLIKPPDLLRCKLAGLLEQLQRAAESGSLKPIPSIWTMFWTQYVNDISRTTLLKAERYLAVMENQRR